MIFKVISRSVPKIEINFKDHQCDLDHQKDQDKKIDLDLWRSRSLIFYIYGPRHGSRFLILRNDGAGGRTAVQMLLYIGQLIKTIEQKHNCTNNFPSNFKFPKCLVEHESIDQR